MLKDDSNGALVKTKNRSEEWLKGTSGKILTCVMLPGTSTRCYLIQTTVPIKGLVDGPKSKWYLEHDLVNA